MMLVAWLVLLVLIAFSIGGCMFSLRTHRQAGPFIGVEQASPSPESPEASQSPTRRWQAREVEQAIASDVTIDTQLQNHFGPYDVKAEISPIQSWLNLWAATYDDDGQICFSRYLAMFTPDEHWQPGDLSVYAFEERERCGTPPHEIRELLKRQMEPSQAQTSRRRTRR